MARKRSIRGRNIPAVPASANACSESSDLLPKIDCRKRLRRAGARAWRQRYHRGRSQRGRNPGAFLHPAATMCLSHRVQIYVLRSDKSFGKRERGIQRKIVTRRADRRTTAGQCALVVRHRFGGARSNSLRQSRAGIIVEVHMIRARNVNHRAGVTLLEGSVE
jgi:hypothetical protein